MVLHGIAPSINQFYRSSVQAFWESQVVPERSCYASCPLLPLKAFSLFFNHLQANKKWKKRLGDEIKEKNWKYNKISSIKRSPLIGMFFHATTARHHLWNERWTLPGKHLHVLSIFPIYFLRRAPFFLLFYSFHHFPSSYHFVQYHKIKAFIEFQIAERKTKL